MTRYGFLGPETTFTHQALLQALEAQGAQSGPVVDGRSGGDGTADGQTPGRAATGGQPGGASTPELVPVASVATATGALIAGELDALMAPIENSVEGGVSGTLDALAAAEAITIIAEQIVPITFVLAAQPGQRLEDVTTVASHPHAQAQVQHWLRTRLPHAVTAAASSTAAAARDLATADPADAAGHAAICSPLAAQHFGLETLAEGIEDTVGAQTRFVLVARDGRIPARTGHDRTTIVVKLAHDRAGALLEALELFSANGVNLSRIESRPTGDALGRYSFSIDIEGHLADRRVASALRGLHRVCPQVHFLGSYPRCDRAAAAPQPGYEDRAYDEARDWVEQLSATIAQPG